MSVFFLTALSLLAFAANSLLCRMALGAELIDPASFTSIRLVSGALLLWPLARWSQRGVVATSHGSWASATALFIYALAFSFAYLSLSTGMGALILFGMVQMTMLAFALRSGERLRVLQWAGFAGAAAGLVYLVSPGLAAPDPLGAVLMAGAGIAWGVYSIRGRGEQAPIAMTAGNFMRAVPLTLAVSAAVGVFALQGMYMTRTGVALALVSGAITSGLGYVVWYRVLPSLRTSEASIVQLLVPVLAALAGVAVLGEALSGRLLLSSALILGGVALAVRRSP